MLAEILFVNVITSSVAPAPPSPAVMVMVCANAVPLKILMIRPLSPTAGAANVAASTAPAREVYYR